MIMNTEVQKLVNEAAIKAVTFIMNRDDAEALAIFKMSVVALCKELNIAIPQVPENCEGPDIRAALHNDILIKHIAAKPRNCMERGEMDYIVRQFFAKNWMMKPEEVKSNDVAQLLDFADPYSHFRILLQRIVIECIHALSGQELRDLEYELEFMDFPLIVKES